MVLVKLQLERFDNSFNSEAWKIRAFSLKNCFFKEESSFTLHEAWKSDMCGRFWPFQKIFQNVSRWHIWMQLKLWDPRYTSEPIEHHSEIYKVDLKKINFDIWNQLFGPRPGFFNSNVSTWEGIFNCLESIIWRWKHILWMMKEKHVDMIIPFPIS